MPIDRARDYCRPTVVVSLAHPPLLSKVDEAERLHGAGHTVIYFIIMVAIRGSHKESGVCQWFPTIGGLGRARLRLLEPRPVGWGKEIPGTGSTIGNESQRPVPRLSYPASGPPLDVAENNNTLAIRRIYHKVLIFQSFNRDIPVRLIYVYALTL